ncbi:unnamed protein product [Nezara viridula]|uniref:Uncharacterized protein n=1 Tax=Nezara viridula TaxID=85310 RepID=A0A9P0E6E4_NEZVI|nr:unnamed protein product [Nezara viridula]
MNELFGAEVVRAGCTVCLPVPRSPSSVAFTKGTNFKEARSRVESRSNSQGQVNSAVAAKEHSRVHHCLGLALRKL